MLLRLCVLALCVSQTLTACSEESDTAGLGYATGAMSPANPECDALTDDGCIWTNGWTTGWTNAWRPGFRPSWQTIWRLGQVGDKWVGMWDSQWGQFTQSNGTVELDDRQFSTSDSWSYSFAGPDWHDLIDTWGFDAPGVKTWIWADGENTPSKPACAHPLSRTGVGLSKTCSNIVAQVCKASEFASCCALTKVGWSKKCVDRASQIATGNASATHDVFTVGEALTSKTGTCAEAVCTGQGGLPGCCSSAPGALWDASCVQRANEKCTSKYLARPRVETDSHGTARAIVDLCIEPKVLGVAKCGLKPTTSSGSECCVRAMALQGVYTVNDTSKRMGTLKKLGRQAAWYRWLDIPSPLTGVKRRVNVTLVPDPFAVMADGAVSKEGVPVHKLWLGAGTDRPLFPDCTTTDKGPRCDCRAVRDPNDHINNSFYFEPGVAGAGSDDLLAFCGDVVPGRKFIDRRQVLLGSLSALLTTNGFFQLDLRWNDTGPQSPFAYNDSFDDLVMEAVWQSEYLLHETTVPRQAYIHNRMAQMNKVGDEYLTAEMNYYMFSRPVCYAAGSSVRADGLITDPSVHTEWTCTEAELGSASIMSKVASENLPYSYKEPGSLP